MPVHKSFQAIFDDLADTRNRDVVFSDFCEFVAILLVNAIVASPERQARHDRIVSRYSNEEISAFRELLRCVAANLDLQTDYLGDQFRILDLAKLYRGQFFTPMSVARLMAGMVLATQDLSQLIQEKGFVRLYEPTAGSGVLVIAFASLMQEAGFDPTQHLHVTAVDVDPTAAYMCFIQLSLLEIPAVVHVGNSLSQEIVEELWTPAHYRWSR